MAHKYIIFSYWNKPIKSNDMSKSKYLFKKYFFDRGGSKISNTKPTLQIPASTSKYLL